MYDEGLHDQYELFDRLNNELPYNHYSQIREAIHEVKTSLTKRTRANGR